MADANRPVQLEEVDWASVFPFVRLFGSFRMAIHAPTLMLALLLTLMVYWGGLVLDSMWGPQVYPGEVEQFAGGDTESFETWRREQEKTQVDDLYREIQWLNKARELAENPDRIALALEALDQHFKKRERTISRAALETDEKPTADQEAEKGKLQADIEKLEQQLENLEELRRESLASVRALSNGGIFNTALGVQLDAFGRLVGAAATLNFGLAELIGGEHDRKTVVGSLREAFVTTPRWLCHTYPWFLLVLCLWVLAVWSLLGGAIARVAALRATRDYRASLTEAIRFAASRWIWYFVAPLIPLLIVLGLGLVLAVAGFAFGNLAILDIVGSFLFGFALFFGTLMAVALIGLAAVGSLLYPAIGAEGTDAFDAISRAYNYVLGRPWQWLFYSGISLVYGAICYLFVGLMIFLSLSLTHCFVGAWTFAETAPEITRFEAIMPAPRLGELMSFSPDWSALGYSGKIAAAVVLAWIWLFCGLLAAFAIGFYFSANTWIYLLLRRSADGTEFDDVFVDETTVDSGGEGDSGGGGTGGADSASAAPSAEPSGTDQAPASDNISS